VHSPEIESHELTWRGWAEGAHVKILSRDDETGAVTVLLDLPSGYERAEGHHAGNCELVVLAGALEVGDRRLRRLSYVYSPPRAMQEPWRAAEATQVIFMTRTGPPELLRKGGGADVAGRIRLGGDELSWGASPIPNGPPNIEAAVLRLVAETGEMSLLTRGSGPRETPFFEYHDCVEECFLIDGGSITLDNSGTMRAGSYFWRPPYVTHGPVRTEGDTVLYVYTDSKLVNHYFTDDGNRTPEDNRREAEREAARSATA
jgi:hypothetical protein